MKCRYCGPLYKKRNFRNCERVSIKIKAAYTQASSILRKLSTELEERMYGGRKKIEEGLIGRINTDIRGIQGETK